MSQLKVGREAFQLRRRVYASLPSKVKLAMVFIRLALSSKDAMGLMFYALFAMRNVKGLPKVKGVVPDSTMVTDFRKAHRVLPKGYGKAFAANLFGILNKTLPPRLRGVASQDIIEDTLQQVFLKFMSRPELIKEGVDLPSAEAYVIASARNVIRDFLRSRSTQREVQIPVDDKGQDVQFVDPDALQDALRGLDPIDARRALQEIMALPKSESHSQILTLRVMEGLRNSEIANEMGVSESAVSQAFQRMEPGLNRILRKYLD